jgi:hypothetical protein
MWGGPVWEGGRGRAGRGFGVTDEIKGNIELREKKIVRVNAIHYINFHRPRATAYPFLLARLFA